MADAVDAAERNSFEEFSAALTLAEQSGNARALQPLRDLRDLWVYSRTNRIGAFFDDESANGKFTELAARYPDYRAFIERQAVRSSDGRVLYPTAETRQFLLDEARRAAGTAPSFVPPAPQRIELPPTVSPVESQPRAAAADTPRADATATSTPSAAAPPAPTCAQPIRIDSIVIDSRGLTVRGSGPVIAKVAGVETVGEEGFDAFTNVTVEIAFAELGNTPARVTSEEGPFASLRAVRYQTTTDCGVRIRLQARGAEAWVATPVANGVLVGPREVVQEGTFVAGRDGAALESGASGSVRLAGTYFGARGTGTSADAGATQLTFATQLGTVGTLRGFVSQVLPQSANKGRFAAIGLTGLFIGGLQTEVGFGDLSIPVGGSQSSSSINSLTMRGAAASAFPNQQSAITIFGGRAATPVLRRLFDTRQIVDVADDLVYGAAMSHRADTKRYGFGGAVIRSDPRVGGAYTNFLQWAQLPTGRPYGLRLVAEQSIVRESEGEQRGYAWTVEPRATTRRVTLGGFYRYTSPTFHPPLSSSFFATLRRMYSAYGTYRATERFSAAASMSQAKSFSLFDEPESGTLSSSISSSISYRVTEAVGFLAAYSEGKAKSDPGVLAGTNSQSETLTGGMFYSRPRATFGAHLSRNHVRSYTDGQELESLRVDTNAAFTPRDTLHYYARAYWGKLDSTTSTAGSDLGASAGVQSMSKRAGTVRAEAGYAATPRGVTIEDTTQFFASVGYTPPTSLRSFDGGVQLSFQSVRVHDQPARNVLSFMVTMGRLLEWGPEPRPIALYESRAMSMGQHATTLPHARLNVVAFEDANGNAVYDEGERLVEAVRFSVDGVEGVTSPSGDAAVVVIPGSHQLQVDSALVARGYMLRAPIETSFTVRPGERRDVMIPLQPAGRLIGSLVFEGEPPDETVFAGLRISATGVTSSEIVTSGREFQFGLLPEGEYDVTLDPATLAPTTRLVGDGSRRIVIRRNARVAVSFTLRRATARERLESETPPEL